MTNAFAMATFVYVLSPGYTAYEVLQLRQMLNEEKPPENEFTDSLSPNNTLQCSYIN